jgi:hypothetical protein
MQRLLRAKYRPHFVKFLLAALLLMCLGGYGFSTQEETGKERSFINDDPKLIQVYSPNKLELGKVEAEVIQAVLPVVDGGQFSGPDADDRTPVNFLGFLSNRAQAPPSALA